MLRSAGGIGLLGPFPKQTIPSKGEVCPSTNKGKPPPSPFMDLKECIVHAMRCYELVLENTPFVLSMRQNLISVSVLDKAGYIHDGKWSHFVEKCETNSCGNFGTSTMQAEFVACYEAKK